MNKYCLTSVCNDNDVCQQPINVGVAKEALKVAWIVPTTSDEERIDGLTAADSNHGSSA